MSQDPEVQDYEKAKVWAECAQWFAEQGFPIHDAKTRHNPYAVSKQWWEYLEDTESPV